jgi:hypothetical protein
MGRRRHGRRRHTSRDVRRAPELRIATAFAARSLVSPKLAEHLRGGYDALHDVLVLLILHAQETGEVAADLDPLREAAALFALADGLGTHVLIGHRGPEAALAVLDEHLDHQHAAHADTPPSDGETMPGRPPARAAGTG